MGEDGTRTRQYGPGCFVRERDVVSRLIYMAHPLGGDVSGNLERAKAWLRYLTEGNPWVAFACQWVVECEIWDDADPEERRKGIGRCLAMVERCDELWLVGPRVSSGMAREAAHAKEFGVQVVDFTLAGLELPPGCGASVGGRVAAIEKKLDVATTRGNASATFGALASDLPPGVTKLSHCKSCNAPVYWCKTKRDKTMPVDAVPNPEADLCIAADGVVGKGGIGPRYTSHFATCPEGMVRKGKTILRTVIRDG